MSVSKEILDIYEKPVLDGKSRFQLWEEGLAFGSSITPSTFSPEYRKQFIKILINLLPNKHFKKILALGCGNAKIEKDLHDIGYDILATDISEHALELAQNKGLNTKLLNAKKSMPFETNSFDIIFSDGVIGHLFDENQSIDYLLQNSLNILSSGGALVIANDQPTKSNIEIQKHDNLDVYWISQKYLEKVLEQNGFEAVQSFIIPYARPGYDTRHRVITCGFKSKYKESTPNFK